MPRRILEPTIHTNRKINSISDFQFRLWAYLLTYVDDYGRGSADPELLKGFLFPRRRGITESSIDQALTALANAGLIRLYEVNGEPHLYFPNWSEHQRIQRKYSEFPAPPTENDESTVSHRESPSSTVSHRESPLEVEVTRREVNPSTEDRTPTMRARARERDFDRKRRAVHSQPGHVYQRAALGGRRGEEQCRTWRRVSRNCFRNYRRKNRRRPIREQSLPVRAVRTWCWKSKKSRQKS